MNRRLVVKAHPDPHMSMPLCVKWLFSCAVGRGGLARVGWPGLGVVWGLGSGLTYRKCRCIRV